MTYKYDHDVVPACCLGGEHHHRVVVAALGELGVVGW